jgi:hypothetical protein
MPVSRCRSVLAVALLFPALLGAQSRAIEIGMDGGLQYGFDTETSTFDLPFQRLRAAFPAGGRFALEPAFSLAYADLNGATSTAVRIQLGGLYALSLARLEGAFVRPFLGFGINDIEVDGLVSEDITTVELGAGIGTRTRIADRLALRFEGSLRGSFPSDDLENDIVLGLTIGASFFSR